VALQDTVSVRITTRGKDLRLEEGKTTHAGRRWRRILIVLAICVLVAIVAAALLRGPREPQHNGKTLSGWVEYYVNPTNYWERIKAVRAIQAIGPRALPWLVGWARYDTPHWQTKLAEHCKRLKLDWPSGYLNERSRRHELVWVAFGVLGPRANPALPEIEQIALKSSSPQDVESALNFLSQMPDGVPALLRVIAGGKGQRRLQAIHYIYLMPNLGTNGTAAVAALLKCLKDDDKDVVASAARALGSVALKTKDVVPALTPYLRDSRREVSGSASSELGNLANHPAAIPNLLPALPQFVAAQQSTDYWVRAWATNVIWKIAPEVLANGVKDF
jgi:HEAT repeat protein